MSHIEFVSPPGAGKSTVHRHLTSEPKFFGGIGEDAVRRRFLQRVKPTYSIPYRMIPSFIRSIVEDEFIEHRLRPGAFDDFVQQYPGFLNVLSTIVAEADNEPKNLFRLCKTVSETYQLGASTVTNDEILCLDEGFAQRMVSILWRFGGEYSLEEYLRSTPTPALVVYLDVPVDVCVTRQSERGRMSVSKDWTATDPHEAQKNLDAICREVKESYQNCTRVITVENVDTIDAAIDSVRSAIEFR